MQLYARFGVPFYYIVDAKAQTVQPYELVEGVYRPERLLTTEDELTCPLLPGISMPVSDLFL